VAGLGAGHRLRRMGVVVEREQGTSMDTVVPNIGSRQRRIRMAGGVLGLVGSAALLAVLLLGDTPRAARLLVALPVWAGALGVFQAKAST